MNKQLLTPLFFKKMDNCRSQTFTTVKLTNGLLISIFVPSLEGAKMLLKNKDDNLSLELPGPQLLHYLALSNEITKQIPSFEDNKELVYIFTDSWRNSSLEYTDAFIILANELQLV